jgi:hypothetical protein
MRRLARRVGFSIILLALAAPALPCTAVVSSPENFVSQAEVIVRVRAEGRDASGVTFSVLGVVKGHPQFSTIKLRGYLVDRDDRNDHPSP